MDSVEISSPSNLPGFDGGPLPNTFFQHSASARLGIILPGAGYTAQAPLLYYARSVLSAAGADVLLVDRYYSAEPGFAGLPPEDQRAAVRADAIAAWRAGCAQRDYEHVTVIGKSLGTWALADLLMREPAARQADTVWLTPLLRRKWVREAITRCGGRSLFIIGTADPRYDPGLLTEVRENVPATVLVIDGGDHGFEIPGQPIASIQVLERVVAAMQAFTVGHPTAS